MQRDVSPRLFPIVDASAVPWLSVPEMQEVDHLMVDVLGIGLLRMMENAGRSTAVVTRHLLVGTLTVVAFSCLPDREGTVAVASSRPGICMSPARQ